LSIAIQCIDHMESKSTDVDDAITIGSTSFMLDADNTDRDNNYSDAEKDNDVSDMDTIFEHDYEYHDHQSRRVESLDNEPHVGMEFDSFEEARDFYNIYAFKAGFSIRKTSHYKAKKHDNMVTAHQYCCSKQGHSTRPSHENEKTTGSDVQGTPQKDYPTRRTGCKARMRVRMVEPQKWIIVTFEKDHNHELITTPTKTFFRSHKTITTEQKQLIYMLNEQNISTSQIMSFLAAKEGGRNYEFETEWVSLIERYNLHDNNHLSLLWRGRHQWAPVFFRDTFFAGMSMSQRSEGMNALSKILLDSRTSVYKFVQQFEKLVASRHEKEDEQDFKTASGEASLWSYDPIEKQARDVYTHTLFKEVKRQLKYATGYRLVELQKNVSYKISNFMNPDLRKQSLCSYIVSVDLSEKKINCNCKMEGIVKDHAPGRLVVPQPSQFNMEMEGFGPKDPPQSQCKRRERDLQGLNHLLKLEVKALELAKDVKRKVNPDASKMDADGNKSNEEST
ncbi:Protein FAR1-RELATED SEQUENCE 5, partial [Ananas comosus]